MDQNRSNGSKWTKLTKWIEFDQSGLNWTEIDQMDRSRLNGPNDSLICSHFLGLDSGGNK